jgi:hypothetical protein
MFFHLFACVALFQFPSFVEANNNNLGVYLSNDVLPFNYLESSKQEINYRFKRDEDEDDDDDDDDDDEDDDDEDEDEDKKW